MAIATDTITVKVPDPSAFLVPDVVREPGITTYREPRIAAAVSLRDDPLGLLYHRGRDDCRIGEAQYRAGRQWQATYEAAGVGRLRSPGDIREPVDGGGIVSDGITDRQMRAHKTLNAWHAELGREGRVILEAVLAEKRSLREVAQDRYGGATPPNVRYVGRRFRECLSTLATAMGLAS